MVTKSQLLAESSDEKGSLDTVGEFPPCFSAAAQRNRFRVWGPMKPSMTRNQCKAYVMKTGVWDALSIALRHLHIQKQCPDDPKQFLLEHLGPRREPWYHVQKVMLTNQIKALQHQLDSGINRNEMLSRKLKNKPLAKSGAAAAAGEKSKSRKK